MFRCLDHDQRVLRGEPIACWGLDEEGDVHAICTMGSVVDDAANAENYLGVAAPGQDMEVFKGMLDNA
jgi:hypothetical protein